MASKARNPQEYVWLSPDKAGFADQLNAFCVLINDPVAANIMAGDIKDNESALKMPGVPDGAKLKELVFKLVTQLAQSVKATRSSDEIRGPMLAPLKQWQQWSSVSRQFLACACPSNAASVGPSLFT